MIVPDAIHFDTVRLSHAFRRADLPNENDFLVRGFEIGFKERELSGVICHAVYRPFGKNSHEPRVSITVSERGYSGIWTEFSIAKLLDGNGLGIQTDEDLECSLDAIDDFIRQKAGIEFDARTAKVKRLDANGDFNVGENQIRPFIRAISCCPSRMTAGTVGETTKQFFNRSRSVVVYGKRDEVQAQFKRGAATEEDVKAAEGLLRVEARFRGQSVQRLADKLKVPADAQHLLTIPVAERIVASALTELGLDTPMASAQSRDQLLLDSFGKDAPTMLGVLEWRARHGEDFWKSLGWSPAKYYRLRSQLREANLWDTAPDDEELPALAIAA